MMLPGFSLLSCAFLFAACRAPNKVTIELTTEVPCDDSPVTVASSLTTATGVSVKDAHACALLSDGTVMCCGANYYGQLGDGTKTDALSPLTVQC
jgi:alpha-tubulin suppressor-like RCC1 family protein